MKKLFAVAIMSAALAACGGSKKPATTPDTKTEMNSGATGGQTYGSGAGSAMAPGGSGSSEGAPAGASSDPCAGGQ